MCSVNESDGDHYMVRKPLPIRNGELCKKCDDQQAEVVLRVKDCYCRNCFLAAATHKFRSSIGKSKLVRPTDHILIAFSGSASSLSLVHLTHAGKNEQNHKKLLFSISVVYIDEGVVLGMNQEERKNACENVNCLAKTFGFPVYISMLSESLDVGNNRSYNNFDSSHDLLSSEKNEALKRLFNSVKNLTQKDDLLQALRTRLLIRIAKQLKCNKIFTAETGTYLSVKLLSNVSLGRGAHIPLDVGFCDGRDPEVKTIRPMREFMKKEIMFYSIFHNLEPLCLRSLTTKALPHASIQKLTEKFVTELQEDFPATVSTILRTGDKLSGADNSANPECTCALCGFIEKFQEVKEATRLAAAKATTNGTGTGVTPVTSANASPITARACVPPPRSTETPLPPSDSTPLLEPPNSTNTSVAAPLHNSTPNSQTPATVAAAAGSVTVTANNNAVPNTAGGTPGDSNTLKTSLVAHQRSQSLSGLQPGESPKHQAKTAEKPPATTPAVTAIPAGSAEAQLKYENDRLKLALAQSSANAKKWEIELATLKNNNVRLTSALQESTANVEEWKRQLHSYKEENQRLKTKYVELEAAKGSTEAAAELRKELQSLRARVETLEQELKAKDEEVKRLCKQQQMPGADQQSLQGRSQDERCKNLQQENAELQAAVSLAQAQLETALSAQESQRRVLETLNAQLAARLQELAGIHREIATALQT